LRHPTLSTSDVSIVVKETVDDPAEDEDGDIGGDDNKPQSMRDVSRIPNDERGANEDSNES
jgi:hypothetical protein